MDGRRVNRRPFCRVRIVPPSTCLPIVELISPVAARLLGMPDGKVAGKPNLRAYFQRGLEAYPELRFHIEDVLWGINSIVLYYTNQMGTGTAEFMELSASGKVVRVVATYNA